MDAVPDLPPLQEYFELQARESLLCESLADDAAQVCYVRPLHELSKAEQYEMHCGASYTIRRRHAAWRAAAVDAAVPAVAQLLREEVPGMTEAQARRLATMAVGFSTAKHNGVLEGTEPITPQAYLRIRAAVLEGWRR
jgi:hypothetical protein